MASFGPIAPHYDILMSQIPYSSWVGYYRLLMGVMECEPLSHLDLCCGTGTVAEILAEEGYDVAGVDLSPDMIAEARRKAAEKGLEIEYFVQDASDLHLPRTFQAACSFFDSLNYITTAEGFAAALSGVARHLEPGGLFVFDLNTAFAFEEKLFDQQDRRKKAKIQYDWKGSYDPETLLIEVDMTFWLDGQEFKEVHRQRAHPEEEVVAGLEAAGFGMIRAFDAYTLDPPRPSSDRVHYAAVLTPQAPPPKRRPRF